MVSRTVAHRSIGSATAARTTASRSSGGVHSRADMRVVSVISRGIPPRPAHATETGDKRQRKGVRCLNGSYGRARVYPAKRANGELPRIIHVCSTAPKGYPEAH